MQLKAVGYFCKTHGVKGHLILKEEVALITEGLPAVFIDGATGKAPYFISEIRDTNNGLILKLEEINAVETAKTLINKTVYVDAQFVEEDEETANWSGFEIIDKNHGSLGIVTGSSSNGTQDLLSVNYKGKEVILPLVEEFIEKLDEDLKKIWYAAPEGLIELYLTDSAEEEESEEQ